MNTFLPEPTYEASARALDNRRLVKQLTECWQLILCYVRVHGLVTEQVQASFGHYKLISKPGLPQMRHHPCYKMWDGNIGALIEYTKTVAYECMRRNFAAGALGKLYDLEHMLDLSGPLLPTWWPNDAFTEDCRANLMRKEPSWYKYPNPPQDGYRWPS